MELVSRCYCIRIFVAKNLNRRERSAMEQHNMVTIEILENLHTRDGDVKGGSRIRKRLRLLFLQITVRSKGCVRCTSTSTTEKYAN